MAAFASEHTKTPRSQQALPRLTTDAVCELLAPSVSVLLLLADTERVALSVELEVCKDPTQRQGDAQEGQ
jgi:hypothetical protein